MRQTRFFLTKTNNKESNNHIVSMVSKLLFYSGIVVLMSAFIYMIGNLAKADSFVSIWLVFVITGVSLILSSVLISKDGLFKRL